MPVQSIVGLLVAIAPLASAVVCDEASSMHVPCVNLQGGHKMPTIAMGTWSGSYKDCQTSEFTCVQDSARFAVETWLHLGGTHIDTANDYRTQVAVAQGLRNHAGQKREELFITTKCPGAIGYNAIIQCADDNLQMLGQFTDQGPGYIDLLLVHFPYVVNPVCRFDVKNPNCTGFPGANDYKWQPVTDAQLQDSWRAMEDLKKIGVVKAIGVSDYNTTQLSATLATAKEPIEVHQVEWNPTDHDLDMQAFCKKNGIQLQAWSPLGGQKGSCLSSPVVKKIAAAHNVSTAQVVLRWSVQQGVAVVVGTANPDHAASDKAIFDFTLSDEDMSSISGLRRAEDAESTTSSLLI